VNGGELFDFAWDETEIIHVGKKPVLAFGETILDYILIAGHEDLPDKSFLRSGEVMVSKPLIHPVGSSPYGMNGFGKKNEHVFEYLISRLAVIPPYKFSHEQSERTLHNKPREKLADIILTRIQQENPSKAVIMGSDSAWQVSVMKLVLMKIKEYLPRNIDEFREKGMF